MYAIIESGGKQQQAEPEQLLRVEKLPSKVGDTVVFDRVLCTADGANLQFGTPYLDGVRVTAEVIAHGRDKKINVIKFKRRKKYRRLLGHRQPYTELRITGIEIANSAKAETNTPSTSPQASGE